MSSENQKHSEPVDDFSTHPLELRMTQILSVPYETNQGTISRILYGIGVDGAVYKYHYSLKGWSRLPMGVVIDPYANMDRKPRKTRKDAYDPSF